MRIQILGSAAAEAVPALWCNCECCTYARKHGGKDLRRRCSYSIDKDTLVDFGPDAFWQTVEFDINLTKIERIIYTHSHEDHLNPIELEWRMNGYSKVARNLKIFAPPGVFERIKEFKLDIAKMAIDPVVLQGDESVEDGDLTIVPIPAQHMPNQLCLNYIIKRGGKSILIANDTGWWSDSSWALAATHKLDAAIIECTFALSPTGLDMRNGHLGAYAAKCFRDKLAHIGALNSNAKVAVNHYSHNGMPLQSKLEEYYKDQGIEVGFDGMVLEI